MKTFKFDHETKAWDRYKAFHNSHWGLVEFETGEVMVKNYVDSHDRMMYDKYGIQLVATTDTNCPDLYLDKECTELCKKAWVTQHGMQELAIDWEQKVAIALQGRRYDETGRTELGTHVHSALAYWAGAERRPVPMGLIKVQTPNPEFKKKVQGILLSEVVPAITALDKMQDKRHHWTERGKYPAKEEWLDSSAQEIVADICNVDDWQKGRDLKHIAEKGFEYPRSTQLVDFLYVKGEYNAPR
jgi:hypothetical protein